MSNAEKPITPPPDFASLYQEYAGLVRSVVFRMSGKQHLDDTVQDVFVRIWQSLDKFAGKSSLRTWIYRIAVNTTIDHLRKNSRNVLRLVTTDTSELVATDDGDTVSAEDLINKALATLSVDFRTTLVLHAFEGLSTKEVASVLNIAEGTVKSRLKRARDQVAVFLKNNGVTI